MLQQPDKSEVTARAILDRYIEGCFVKNAIAGRLAGEVPGYLFQEGVNLAAHVRLSGSFDVSPQVEGQLTKWCRRFLEWGANHQPDDVPGVSVAASEPKTRRPPPSVS